MYKNGTPSNQVDKKISENGGLRTGMLEGRMDEGIISVNTAIDLQKKRAVRKLLKN